jgi:hypothetical protein
MHRQVHTGEKLASLYLRDVVFLNSGLVCASAGFGRVGCVGAGTDAAGSLAR